MPLRRRVSCLALTVLLAAAASLPLWLPLPEPHDALTITQADCRHACDAPSPVPLPLARATRGGQTELRLAFDLDAVPQHPLYLFIPMLSQRAVVSLNGSAIADTGTRTQMLGVTSGTTALMALPAGALSSGRNTVSVRLRSSGVGRGYLSRVYIGTARQLAPYFRLRLFLLEHLRLMAMAAQLLITVAVLVAWCYRPREALFGWTLLLLVMSLPAYTGLLIGLARPPPHWLLPYGFILNTGACVVLQIIALLVSGVAVPWWLKACVPVAPVLCALAGLSGAVSPEGMVMALGVPMILVAALAATIIAAWGALAKGVNEAWLLLAPLLVLLMASLHDGAIIARWLNGPVFFAFYYRQALALAIAVILARRLGISLRQLDDSNARLQRRLAQREQELSRLHENERRKAAERILNEERRRLTADLHDGISGHLASIIALAEREHSPSIERSAREALDDLRAVIHSLDIGDSELVVALAGFRERLERQLKRTGIVLHWSMAHLPEISGVTPAHALNVLRILQEAVTNAVRHGPATRISIQGLAGAPGRALVSVENDGVPFSTGGGLGLDNMKRRARQLGGAVHVEAQDAGTRVLLELPGRLPERVVPAGEEDAPARVVVQDRPPAQAATAIGSAGQ